MESGDLNVAMETLAEVLDRLFADHRLKTLGHRRRTDVRRYAENQQEDTDSGQPPFFAWTHALTIDAPTDVWFLRSSWISKWNRPMLCSLCSPGVVRLGS